MSELSLTDAMSSLASELCAALAYYANALTTPRASCLADISECNRRGASLTADMHARLFTAFCPPLPRTQSVAFCETLHGTIEGVFYAAMLLSADYHPSARLDTVAGGLVRMSELIKQEVDTLPCVVRGRGVSLPDPHAYHAELTRVRAALALYVTHGERSRAECLAVQGAATVADALQQVYTAWLSLFAEAI